MITASAFLRGRQISYEEAEEQFDILFDEFCRINRHRSGALSYVAVASVGDGNDVLESSGSSVECDEAYQEEAAQKVEQRQAIQEVAQELKKLGDKYNEQFGQHLHKADKTLTALFTQTAALEYATFKNTVESITGHDRDAADFVFMMCLTTKVVGHIGSAGNKAKNFFRRYIGQNYIPRVQEAGGVREYVPNP